MVRRIYLLIGCLVFVGVPHVEAQQWATKMFKTTSHDFGTVAAGSKSEFSFEFQNVYEEEIHVAGVRSSCGCTSLRVVKDTLKTWEKSAIVATYNTRTFRGQRGATITVVFDRPYYAEVQLNVNGFIRGDVMFDPGEVRFGDVEMSSPAQQQVTISYAGRHDWRIVDVRSANQNLEVELTEEGRRGGQTVYHMTVRLKPDAPAGQFQDQLSLVTNDSQSRTIPIAVHGNVVAPVTVSPSSLFLGVLEPGQSVTKNLVVKGKQPFQVECIDCEANEKLQFKAPASDEKKNVYVIPVTFTAGDAPGEFTQKIRIKTSFGEGVECCCVATATVRASTPSK